MKDYQTVREKRGGSYHWVLYLSKLVRLKRDTIMYRTISTLPDAESASLLHSTTTEYYYSVDYYLTTTR